MSRRLRESLGARPRRLWSDGVVSWDALFGIRESFRDIWKEASDEKSILETGAYWLVIWSMVKLLDNGLGMVGFGSWDEVDGVHYYTTFICIIVLERMSV
jgi:hypothetical protein